MNEILKVFEYRRKIKALKDEGNALFDKANAEKRSMTDEENQKLAGIQKNIDETEGEMDDYIRLNKIPDEELRNFEPNKPDPGKVAEERKAEKRNIFFKYMREGRDGLNREERALVEDTTGLYLVPEDIESEIYRGLPQVNVIRQLATVRRTTRDKVRKRSLTELSVGWGKLETGTAITESTPTPSTDYIYVEDLYGLTKIGEDELMDNDDILAQIIADSFKTAIANAEAAAFVVGTGHTYSQPDGVTLNATVISTYTDLDTADTCVPDDLLDIEYGLPAQYRKGACFLMHQSTGLQVRKVKATNGPYLWQPSLQVGMPESFDGFPVHFSNDMIVPASGNVDRSIVALFGNWKLGYVIVDRLGISIQRLNELYSEAGLIGFKVHFRVGGGVVRADCFRALDNNT